MSVAVSADAPSENATDVIIDCSHTRYHVVRAAARMMGWAVNDGDTEESVPDVFHGVPLTSSCEDAVAHLPQVIWMDKSALSPRVAELRCFQRLNHFSSMHVIARKAILFRRLMHLRRLLPQSEPPLQDEISTDTAASLYRFFDASIPPSFSSLGDRGRLEAYQQELQKDTAGVAPTFFIIKPNTGCEGRGIRLTTSPLDGLREVEKTDKKHECIIQLYIDRPLLLEGKKFDLRLYVLLVSVTPPPPSRPQWRAAQFGADVGEAEVEAPRHRLEVEPVPPAVEGVHLFVHREGLVRICAEPYAAPTDANCTDALLHLTNYAVNKTSTLFKPARSGQSKCADTGDQDEGNPSGNEGNKRSLAALAAHIEGMRIPGGWAGVQRRIDECITLTVLSGVEVLRRELISAGGARGDRVDGRGCFELLGFDVMLREATLEPVLMEVNHSPSLFCDTAFDFAVKSAVLRDTFRVLETHLPPWKTHEGSTRRYAAYTSPGSPTSVQMENAESALISNEGLACGFRSLLPHYRGCGSDGERIKGDWHPDERGAQERMVNLSRQLR